MLVIAGYSGFNAQIELGGYLGMADSDFKHEGIPIKSVTLSATSTVKEASLFDFEYAFIKGTMYGVDAKGNTTIIAEGATMRFDWEKVSSGNAN